MLGDMADDIYAGDEAPVVPRVRNLSLVDAGAGFASASYDVEGQQEGYDLTAYANGVSFRSGVFEPFELGPFASGNVDVDLVPDYESRGRTPRFSVDRVGDRALLRWSQSSESDVVAYRIYHDSKSGTVDYDTIISAVSVVEADEVLREPPTSGSGEGRITVGGSYVGEAINETFRVKITGGGTFQYDVGDGYNGTDIAFTQGRSVSLGLGLSVTFLDTLNSYDINDVWSFGVGPRRWYVSDELTGGTWKFGLKAVDAVGNLGPEIEASIIVVSEPNAPVVEGYIIGIPEDPADPYTVTLRVSHTASVTLNVYSNLDKTFGVVRDYILETNTIASATSTPGGIKNITFQSVVPEGTGLVDFYVRAESGGVEEQNATIWSYNFGSAPASDLSEPFNLSAAAGAGGTATFTWMHDERDGVPSSFNVYVFTSEPDSAAFEAATPTNVARSYSSYSGDVGTQTWSAGVIAGQRWFGVRAVNSSGAETGNVNFATATPDSTAPAVVTGFGGATI